MIVYIRVPVNRKRVVTGVISPDKRSSDYVLFLSFATNLTHPRRDQCSRIDKDLLYREVLTEVNYEVGLFAGSAKEDPGWNLRSTGVITVAAVGLVVACEWPHLICSHRNAPFLTTDVHVK